METWISLTSILEAALVALSIYLYLGRRTAQQQATRQQHAVDAAETRLQSLETQQQQETQVFRETEQKLRSYLQLMDTLVNTIPNPLFFKDTEGIFQGCNQVFAKDVLGLSRDRIIGYGNQDLSEKIPAGLARSLDRYESKLLKTRKVHSFEAQVPCADGQKKDFLFYIAPVFQNDENVTGSIGVMLDLTEKNRATQDRMQKEKFQGVLETAGAVCHELNQPLQILSGYADLVLMETRSDDLPPDLAGQIQVQVDRMADITRKLQDITHYETRTYGDQLKIIDIDRASRPK